MELLGIGPLELIFIILLILLVLGPKDMVKTGRSIGQFLRKTIFSPTWVDIQKKMRNLPGQLIQEAGIEESDLQINIKPDEIIDSNSLTVDIPNPQSPASDLKRVPAGDAQTAKPSIEPYKTPVPPVTQEPASPIESYSAEPLPEIPPLPTPPESTE